LNCSVPYHQMDEAEAVDAVDDVAAGNTAETELKE
jgi:hypothetical protein